MPTVIGLQANSPEEVIEESKSQDWPDEDTQDAAKQELEGLKTGEAKTPENHYGNFCCCCCCCSLVAVAIVFGIYRVLTAPIHSQLISKLTFGHIHIDPGCLPASQQPSHLKDLWCPGDGGYHCYKIPSLLHIPGTETLVAFIEARKHSCDDYGYIDLVLRRSEDNGRTWGPTVFVHGDSHGMSHETWHTIGDSLPLYDEIDKKIHLLFTRDNRDVFYTSSSDLGMSWLRPRNISLMAVKKRGVWVGTGHAGGVQLLNGSLLAPLYGGGHNSFVLASDDHGSSWYISGELDATADEWSFAQTQKNSTKLIGSLRSFPFRRQSFSEDGGKTWTPTEFNLKLPEPFTGCEGAVIFHPSGRLFYSHPDEHFIRAVMAIKRSDDGGSTWVTHTTLWGPGAGCDPPCEPAASYSSMAVLGEEEDSDIGIFFMRNNHSMMLFEGKGASFARFAP
eukprot:gnl/TRDRNA2_/TRDRNA2_176930_c3_seq2.p1 gnl/TRDRNA2_/TRDRNA2_176930_c3~~gnl/TRDRNA2_/TRDRNA2_176930_c3_seq2.p1  ORF type:complete len:448 (-),score=38.63 gnl/TRDRNA2_/TRDRNA2_176930_c3_seq2:229-1572(-)